MVLVVHHHLGQSSLWFFSPLNFFIMVHVVHNHFGHAILSLPMVESNQYGPFWTGSSNQSWMFPLANGGQTIGDHVAPFLSLAPDPTNSCMDFDAIPWTRCNLCWPKQGGEVASLYCHATSWASYAPLILFSIHLFEVVAGSFMWIYFVNHTWNFGWFP